MTHMGGFTAFVAGFNPRPDAITTLVREKTRFYQHKGQLYVLLAYRQLGWHFWLNNAQTSGLYEEYVRHECSNSKIIIIMQSIYRIWDTLLWAKIQ